MLIGRLRKFMVHTPYVTLDLNKTIIIVNKRIWRIPRPQDRSHLRLEPFRHGSQKILAGHVSDPSFCCP